MMPLIDVQGQSWATVEDPSRIGGTDWNMADVGTAQYVSLASAALSKVAGPVAGQQALHIERNGVNNPGAYHTGNLFVVGAPYNVRFSARGDTVNAFVLANASGAALKAFSASNVWQPADVNYVQDASTIGFYVYSGAVAGTGYCEVGPIVVSPLIARTPNLGSTGGRLQMGDGQLSATFPTRTPNTTAGFSFNGSQYLQWMSPVTQGTFSYCALVMRTGAATSYLLDARAGGGSNRVYWDGANLQSGDGTLYVDDVATNVLPYGQIKLVSCSGITIAAPSKLVLGADQALANGFVGNVLGQQLYPGTLTPRQLRDVKNRLMARCWK